MIYKDNDPLNELCSDELEDYKDPEIDIGALFEEFEDEPLDVNEWYEGTDNIEDEEDEDDV